MPRSATHGRFVRHRVPPPANLLLERIPPHASLPTDMPKPLHDVEELISRLEFRSNLGDTDAHPTLVDVHPADGELIATTYEIDLFSEEVAAEALKRYLRGRGHPEHHIMREMLGEATFERDREDTLLRARLFLHSMTGDDLIHSDDLKIQVSV